MSSGPRFKLIRLSEVERPVRDAPSSGAFALIRYRSRAELMAEGNLKPDDFLKWPGASEALAIVIDAFGKSDTARHLIIERLKTGKILAYAESITWSGPKPNWSNAIPIPVLLWQDYYQPAVGFWEAGDIKFYLGHRESYSQSTSVWYQGVRIHPFGIEELVALAPPKRHATPAPIEAKEAQEAEQPQSAPPVSDAHLKAWFDLYKQVYTGADDTEDMALKSARGMFQGKSVTRAKVRVLRGAQKVGRKSRDN